MGDNYKIVKTETKVCDDGRVLKIEYRDDGRVNIHYVGKINPSTGEVEDVRSGYEKDLNKVVEKRHSSKHHSHSSSSHSTSSSSNTSSTSSKTTESLNFQDKSVITSMLKTQNFKVTKVKDWGNGVKDIWVNVGKGSTKIRVIDHGDYLEYINALSGTRAIVKNNKVDVIRVRHPKEGPTIRTDEEYILDKKSGRCKKGREEYKLYINDPNILKIDTKGVINKKDLSITAHSEEEFKQKLSTLHQEVETHINSLKNKVGNLQFIQTHEQILAEEFNKAKTYEEKKRILNQLEKLHQDEIKLASEIKQIVLSMPSSFLPNKEKVLENLNKITSNKKIVENLKNVKARLEASHAMEKALKEIEQRKAEAGREFLIGITVGAVAPTLYTAYNLAPKNIKEKIEESVEKILGLANVKPEKVESIVVDLIPMVGPAISTKITGDVLAKEKLELLRKRETEAAKIYGKEASKYLKEYWKEEERNVEYQTIATAAGIAAGAVAGEVATGLNLGSKASYLLESGAQFASDIASTKLVFGVVRPVDVATALVNFAPLHTEVKYAKAINTEAKVEKVELKGVTIHPKKTKTTMISTEPPNFSIGIMEKPVALTKAKGEAHILIETGKEVVPAKATVDIESMVDKEGYTIQKLKVSGDKLKPSEELSMFRLKPEKKGTQEYFNTFASVYSKTPEKYETTISGVYELEAGGFAETKKGEVKTTLLKAEKKGDKVTSTVHVEDTTNKMEGYIYSETKETKKGKVTKSDMYLIDPSATAVSKQIIEKPKTEKSEAGLEELLGFGKKSVRESEEKTFVKIPRKIKVWYMKEFRSALKLPIILPHLTPKKSVGKISKQLKSSKNALELQIFNLQLPKVSQLQVPKPTTKPTPSQTTTPTIITTPTTQVQTPTFTPPEIPEMTLPIFNNKKKLTVKLPKTIPLDMVGKSPGIKKGKKKGKLIIFEEKLLI